MNRVLLALTFSIVPCIFCFSQFIIKGKVIDKENKKPIEYASINLDGTAVGTASNEFGEFIINIDNQYSHGKFIISSLGYANRTIEIDSIKSPLENQLLISLQPISSVLQEIIVKGKAASPEELLKEAIEAIPQNYLQEPFNMEFYSKMDVTDSLRTFYTIESVLLTYRAGYVPGTMNTSKVIEKRETGTNPLSLFSDKKSKKSYFPYFPGFDISSADRIGNISAYSIFDPKSKLKLKNGGITYFDKDTVCIIHYWKGSDNIKKTSEPRFGGTIYIATNNLAIIRHTIGIASGSGSKDIIYKKYKMKYFPYLIQSSYTHSEKAVKYQVNQSVYLNDIILTNVTLVEHKSENWHPDDVPFNPKYWKNRGVDVKR
ncbi:hypothetical protein BH09BAC3_BH09BAC3_05840 [soil metagenome]